MSLLQFYAAPLPDEVEYYEYIKSFVAILLKVKI